MRRRDPLRQKAAIKALTVPAFFLSLLGCALLIWALRDEEAPGVKDLRQQAAAALPVRAPEPANPVARASTPPTPTADPVPVLPPPRQSSVAPATPAVTAAAPEPLQSNPLRPTPELSPTTQALALAPVRPPATLTPPPGRDAVVNAQREAAAVASAAREATRPAPTPVAATPATAKEREREPAAAIASVEKAGDSFIVILATTESEAEARAQLQQLHKKYAGLGLKKLGYTRVKSNGDYVWRVRSAGHSEEEAEELCEKIAAAGGKCTARSN